MHMSTHALIKELEHRSAQIAAMELSTKIQDEPLTGKLINLANSPADLDRMSRAVQSLTKAGMTPADAERNVLLLVSERHFYGAYCELAAYEWLDRHDVAFKAQVPLTGQDVINPNGCTIDGRIEVVESYFDIKGFGFQAYVMETFRDRLKSYLSGLDVVIDGPSDVAVRDIEAYAFGKLNALRVSLASGGIESIKELGWTIRAQHPRSITISTSTQDPYRLAQENCYYPFKTASQFTRGAPFFLVFPYAAQFNTWLAENFAGSTDITLRALARRAFLQMSTDASPVQKYDSQASPGTSVAQAAKLISGLLFVNLESDAGWFFLNPRATHPLTRYSIEQIFDFTAPKGMGIDDFAYDDY